MGCLIYGIVTLFIGACICVGLGLEGDSVGGLFIMFLCVTGPIIGLIIKSFADEAEKNRIAEAKRLEQQKIENEKRRIEETARLERIAQEAARQKETHARSLVEKISSEYTLLEYRIPQRYPTPMQRGVVPGGLMIPNKNRNVSACFDQHYEEIMQIDTQIYKLQSRAKEILSCPNCSSNEEKLSFLQSKLPELDELRDCARLLNLEVQHKIIHITDFDPTPLENLRNAVLALNNSKKCISAKGSTLKDFLFSKEPKEHAVFHASTLPVALNFGNFVAYCYPKIILIFEDDLFIAATNPNGLKITVTQKEVQALFNSDRKEYSGNKVLADDSLIIQKGYERTTWLHTCKDGSPDLRYSYNPAMHFRDDVVRHGVVLFAIGEYKAEFAFSSHQAYEALVLAQKTYCTNNSAVVDPIPAMLDLLDALGTSRNLVREMRKQQALHTKNILPVCRIIESRTN